MKKYNWLAPFEQFVERKLTEIPPGKLYPRLLAFLIVLGYLPLLIPGIPNGHDTVYHIARLINLREGFRSGILLPLINFDSLEGFGYGTGLFYSDLFFFPFGLISAAGVSPVVAYKLFLFVWGLLTAFSMYHVAKVISGRPFAGFASALLYCWSSYYATDVIIRGAIGEIMAFLFVPWCILGLWIALYDESPKRSCLPLALGYAGLFYSHNITFVLMALIGGLVTLFNLPALLRDVRRIGLFFRAGCLALALAAFAAVPLLEQVSRLDYNLTQKPNTLQISEFMIPFSRLFLELPYMKMTHYQPPGIGIIFVIVFLQRFRIKSFRTPQERFRDLCMTVGFAALIAASEFLPWQGMMRALGSIQFPWRFFLPATAFCAMGGGLLLGALLAGQSAAMHRTWLWILLCGCAFPWWFLHCYEYAAKFSEHEISWTVSREKAASCSTIGGHFLTRRNETEYDGLGGKAPVSSSNPDARTEVRSPSRGKLEISFSGLEPGDSFEIPRIYYKGYRVETEEGGSIDLSERGHFRFRPNASSGTAIVYYSPTMLHRCGFCVSLLTLAGIGIGWLVKRKKASGAAVTQ